MEKVKILGISGAHRKNQTTEHMLEECMESARQLGPWVETEIVHLMDYEIKPCIGCCACYTDVDEEHNTFYCSQKDDCWKVLQKIIEADGIIAASPVYWGGMSGRLRTFIDRTLGFCHGSSTKFRGCCGKKIGAALSIGWDVHGGEEFVIDDIHHWYLTMDTIVVGAGHHHPHGTYVGGAVYKQPYATPTGYHRDTFGMRSVRGTGKRVAEVALLYKLGHKALMENYDEYNTAIKDCLENPADSIQIDWDGYFKVQRHFPTIHMGVPEVLATGAKAIDKYVEWQVIKKNQRHGQAFGDDAEHGLNAEGFKKWITEDLGVIGLTDEELYKRDPEYFEEWVVR